MPLLQAASVWGPGHGPLPLLSLVLLQQLQVNLGYAASRAVSGGPETTVLLGLGLWPCSLLPPPCPGLCHGHLFSTGLLICDTFQANCIPYHSKP